MMPVEDVAFNGDVASDRIIVENYIGPIYSLWAILSYKCRLNERSYDMISAFVWGSLITTLYWTPYAAMAARFIRQ